MKYRYLLWAAAFISVSFDLSAQTTGSFCDSLPRAQYADYDLHSASNEWFQVYEVAPQIFAIYEPWQWQEVISYLIIGKSTAVLFDTGNGMGDIKAVTDQLTDKPIAVVNSHAHIDHVGGNYQFDKIVSVATDFTIDRAKGRGNAFVREEASAAALCKSLPKGVTEDNHHIKPFEIHDVVKSGHKIDIGGRVLELISVPGHTPDSIVMIDRASGYMWTGDTYYYGPIWLYAPETDLEAYQETINFLAGFAPNLKTLFPAHNVPKADPAELIKVRDGFKAIRSGEKQGVNSGAGQVVYEFPTFSILMRSD